MVHPASTTEFPKRMKRTAAILGACTLLAALGLSPAGAAADPAPQGSSPIGRADFRGETVSAEVRNIADWAVHSGDHHSLPFIIVDKVNAKAVAFDRYGMLIASTPVLIGMGVGDKFAPGVLQMDMYQTKPSQRITPAGRFFAEEGRNIQREVVLWVDYDAGIAIHKMPTKRTPQQRAERMVAPDPAEHRITYGCINVPAGFYDRAVRSHFRAKGGFVYVLPDSTPLKSVFNAYDLSPQPVTRARQAYGDRPPTIQRF
jgi:hypothetical protein